LASDDTSEGTVSPAELVFTPLNWATTQTASVTGVPDGIADGDQSYTVAIKAASIADAKYDGYDPGGVTLSNLDNAPMLSDIGSQQTQSGIQIDIPFTIDDPDTPLDDLVLSTTSSDARLVSESNISLSGAGANRTIKIVPADRITGTVTITIIVNDGTTANSDSFVLTVSKRTVWDYYMPLMFLNHTPRPDLVVESLSTTGSGVIVTIRNKGSAPVGNHFWVDLYINPSETPTVNKTWAALCDEGIAWDVTAKLPLGESLTLTLNDAFMVAERTSFDGFAGGEIVYALVDSTNEGVKTGRVLETDEDNNLSLPVTASPTGTTSIPDHFSQPRRTYTLGNRK
jgi:hypothetical protein